MHRSVNYIFRYERNFLTYQKYVLININIKIYINIKKTFMCQQQMSICPLRRAVSVAIRLSANSQQSSSIRFSQPDVTNIFMLLPSGCQPQHSTETLLGKVTDMYINTERIDTNTGRWSLWSYFYGRAREWTQKQIHMAALYLIEITKLYLQNRRIALEAPNIKREIRVIRRWGHGPRDDSQSHCSRGRDIRGADHGEFRQVILLVSIQLVGAVAESPGGAIQRFWIVKTEGQAGGAWKSMSRQRLNREDQRPMTWVLQSGWVKDPRNDQCWD